MDSHKWLLSSKVIFRISQRASWENIITADQRKEYLKMNGPLLPAVTVGSCFKKIKTNKPHQWLPHR